MSDLDDPTPINDDSDASSPEAHRPASSEVAASGSGPDNSVRTATATSSTHGDADSASRKKRGMKIAALLLALLLLAGVGAVMYQRHQENVRSEKIAAKKARAAALKEKQTKKYLAELRPLAVQYQASMTELAGTTADFTNGDASFKNATDATKLAKKELRALRSQLLLIEPPDHMAKAHAAFVAAETETESMVTSIDDYVTNTLNGQTSQETYEGYLEINRENGVTEPTLEDREMLQSSTESYALAAEDFEQYKNELAAVTKTLDVFDKETNGKFKLSTSMAGYPSSSDGDEADAEAAEAA